MIYHLFEGKYLSPFKTDNPKIIGQLKELEREFNGWDGVDTERAKEAIRAASILHGEFMNCDFCGQNNLWEHAESCPLNQKYDKGMPIQLFIDKIFEWESGFHFGLYNESFPESLLRASTFMLGFGRGQSERIKRCEGETDCLYDNDYGKEEYRRIAI